MKQLQKITVVLGAVLAVFANFPASAESAPKTVAAVKVERTNLARAVSLTGEIRAWQEIDIHAKVSGYLKTITVDIGDQVKTGQVIANLDLPEEQQDQVKAEADYQVAKLDYDRIQTIIRKKPGLLAEEDVDKAKATYEEAKATYERMKILSGYAVITAPFDGVITKRSADLGALIQAGTSSGGQAPLVHLAEIDKLRFDFPVPESIVSAIKVGMPVDIAIQADGKVLHSQVARMSDKVDSATRTMDVEADLDNTDLQLKPGLYATAKIALDAKQDALAAPVEAVAMGKNPTVWVINAQNVIEERAVTLGIQMPDKVEITNGVSAGDILVYGNRGDLNIGMKVTPKFIDTKE
jgi:RND family efflux transporter MFP subunit